MSEPQVLVVASVNVDLVVFVAGLPGPGETVTGGRYAESDGGKGANQAVAAARAGASVSLVGAVGDDAHGVRARRALELEGIDVGRLATISGSVATGVALIVVSADGENQIAVAPGANEHVDPVAAVSALDVLEAARAVLVLGLEVPDPPLIAAAARAAAVGVPIVLNPAPARPYDPAMDVFGPVLTPNRFEAATLTGERDPETAARALGARTGAAVVVTLGAEGALLLEPGRAPVIVPAPRVTAVDATGAGDVFGGTLAAALATRMPLARAVELAVAAASRSVLVPGARG